MATQLYYYQNVVPVTSQRHQDWSLEKRQDYEFASHSNSVPLTTIEFPAAASEYSIVFASSPEAVYPVVVLGLEQEENLYIDGDGQWLARYVPAFVRRYPFVFSKTDDENRLLMCIDEKYSGWNQEGLGQRLFDAKGKRAKYLENIFSFLKNYQNEINRTQVFCQKLTELDLLAPVAARFKLPSGVRAELKGFMAIDRNKLNALPGESLAELAKAGELELIYVHLQSMRNLTSLLSRAFGENTDNELLNDPINAEQSKEEGTTKITVKKATKEKKKRRAYTPEFKRDAVALVTEQGNTISEVARKLDINDSLLRTWKRKFS